MTATIVAGFACAVPALASQRPATPPEVAGASFFAASVADLEASQAWYGRVLGVESIRSIESREGKSRAVIMRRGDLVVELIAFDGSRPPEETTPPPSHRFQLQGIVKTGIFVVNAPAWHRHLTGLGVEADEAVMTDDALESRTFVFRDPDGNRIQVFERCGAPCSAATDEWRSTPPDGSSPASGDRALPEPVAASSERRARRRQQSLAVLVERIRADAESPGAILGLRFPDGETTVAAAGVADVASSRPMHADDAFFLGSISKTYTAAVVMRLVEDGRLVLGDRLSRFLPSFPRADDITVAQLLEHRTGLKDFYSYLYFRPDREETIELVTKDWTQDELIELAGRFGHWFEPGEDWSYSSTNYFLLGVVVERASGLSLADAYHRYVYRPLGLEDTWLTWHEPAAGRLSITGYLGPVQEWPHSEMFGHLGPTTVLDRSPVEWGAGGIAATARDATAFLAGLMRGNLLPEQAVSRMLEFHATPPLGVAPGGDVPSDIADAYGLGLMRIDRPGYAVVGHGGLFTGHTAGLWYLPECGVTVALFFNRGFVGQRKALDSVVAGIVPLGGPLAACRGTSPTPRSEGRPSFLLRSSPGAPGYRQRP